MSSCKLHLILLVCFDLPLLSETSPYCRLHFHEVIRQIKERCLQVEHMDMMAIKCAGFTQVM